MKFVRLTAADNKLLLTESKLYGSVASVRCLSFSVLEKGGGYPMVTAAC